MINWSKLKTLEIEVICLIVQRAKQLNFIDKNCALDAQMDIMAAHLYRPIDLSAMLVASDFNFGHDFIGIMNNINRETGELVNCFVPRFAKNQ